MTIPVTLNISDDLQLRQAIKDAIKGEITSIARSEIKGIFASVMSEKVLPRTSEELDKMVREEVRAEVKRQLKETRAWNDVSVIRIMAREEIQNLLIEMIKSHELP